MGFYHITHGMTETRIYTIWVNMKQRCTNPDNNAYDTYGAKGVKVCERWLNSFEDFYNDVKDGYEENLTLDRYPDKNGNYEPSNFRWATQEQQQNNKTSNVYFDFKGQQLTLTQIGRITGISYKKLWKRTQMGMSIDDAVNQGNIKVGSTLYEYNGEMMMLSEISRRSGVDVRKLWARIQDGHSAQFSADWGNCRQLNKKMAKRTNTLKFKCEQMGWDYNKVMARVTYHKISFEEAVKMIYK